jgi:hypothetical protein
LRKLQETGGSETESDRSDDELQEIFNTRLCREQRAKCAQREPSDDAEENEQDLQPEQEDGWDKRDLDGRHSHERDLDEQDMKGDNELNDSYGRRRLRAAGRDSSSEDDSESDKSHSHSTTSNTFTQTHPGVIGFYPNGMQASQYQSTNNIFAARNTIDPNESNNNFFNKNALNFGFQNGNGNGTVGGVVPFWKNMNGFHGGTAAFQNTTNIGSASCCPTSTTGRDLAGQNHVPASPTAQSTNPQSTAVDTPLSPLSHLGSDDLAAVSKKRKRIMPVKAPPAVTDRKTGSARRKA